ncbi:MAG: YadA-like family protein, partial [Alphaproteobacteria bacterium]|nr:YadA-like family protein [Alphaproteobacteria bacterium]
EANAKAYTTEQITAAKTYADGKATAAETNAKAYAENKASTAEANAKAYTTEQITAAKTYADGKATAAETNAKAYTDTLANGAVKNNTDAIAVLNGDETVDGSVAKAVKTAETNAKAYTDAQDAETLASAKTYTDTQDAATLATAQADASAKATAAETNAKSYTDTLIGTTDILVEQNGVIKLGTVNENIAALNNAIGDITDLNQYTEGATIGNALTQGGTQSADTVVAALNNIDATLGTIHGLRDKLAASGAGTNLASGTTVEQHLTALDSAIGNRAYTSTRYISSGSDLSSAVSTLDSNLSRVEGNLDALTRRTQKMHHEMKSGFASLAAMSALVPNARVAGDTQISVGTGHYRGTTGFALGAFHHVNDNILLNAGAAYGGNGSATFKGGLTFGW